MTDPFETQTILVVDDDPDDLLTLRRAAGKARLANPLKTLPDGEAAVAWLSRFLPGGDPAGEVPPVLMILDLKMPRLSGFEVLEWLRAQPGLRKLPVVVFTSSDQDPDVNRAFDLGANSYLVKPVSFQDLVDRLATLGLFWVLLNRHPDVTRA